MLIIATVVGCTYSRNCTTGRTVQIVFLQAPSFYIITPTPILLLLYRSSILLLPSIYYLLLLYSNEDARLLLIPDITALDK